MYTAMHPDPSAARARAAGGFTLMETLIAVAILGIIAGIAIPNYLGVRERTKLTIAVQDIKRIEVDVFHFFSQTGTLPADLAAIGRDTLKDPWGNPYDYWPITGNPAQKVRKDRNTHPINTDFDLYSRGQDGDTAFPLTAKSSQDDIIRANDGGYYGLASAY